MPDGELSHTLPPPWAGPGAGELSFVEEPLTAADATTTGLIAPVVQDQDLDTTVEALAHKIVHNPRISHPLTKRTLSGAWVKSLNDALEQEWARQVALLNTPELTQRSARFR